MANPADTKFDQHIFPLILIEYDLFTIASSNNNLQVIEDTGGTPDDVDITIANGTNTGTELSSLIKTELDSNTANAIVYDVSYDASTHKFTIKNTTNAMLLSIDVSDGDMSATIGFTGDPAGAVSITSDHVSLPGSNSIYISTEAITAGTGNDFDTNGANINYTDELRSNNIGLITKSVSEVGGIASVGNSILEIINARATLRSDFLATYANIQNDQVAISVIFNDGTDLVYSERQLLFLGVFDSPKITWEDFTIPIIDNKKTVNDVLPSGVIDIATYPDADKTAIGKPIQLVFGDFTDDATYVSGGLLQTWLGDKLPCFPSSGLVDRGNSQFLIADHILNQYSTERTLVWLQDYECYLALSANTVQNITAPTDTAWGVSGTISDVQAVIKCRSLERHADDPVEIASFANVIDDDTTTSITVDTTATSLTMYLTLRGGNIDVKLDNVTHSEVGVGFNVGAVSGVAHANIESILNGAGFPMLRVGGGNDYIGVGDNGAGIIEFSLNVATEPALPTTWTELMEYGFGFIADKDLPAPGDVISMQIFDMYVFVKDLIFSIPRKTITSNPIYNVKNDPKHGFGKAFQMGGG